MLYVRLVKPIFDRTCAAAALVVLSPLLLGLAMIVRWRLGSPSLYWQQRIGMANRPFWLCKFRSMNNKRDRAGILLPDARRLTRFGKWLRSTSLDELPGLWNILRGEMSLIGPRPLLPRYLPLYSPEQARRHEVKPGLSGLAQTEGRNSLSWEERFRLDIEYVDQISFWLDAQILGKTLWCVWKREGVSASDHATMYPFTGANSDAERPAKAA
ncbi:MAG: sugar transferase [Aeoliella sp.]